MKKKIISAIIQKKIREDLIVMRIAITYLSDAVCSYYHGEEYICRH